MNAADLIMRLKKLALTLSYKMLKMVKDICGVRHFTTLRMNYDYNTSTFISLENF